MARQRLAMERSVCPLSPNLAAGYFQKGTTLIYSGRPQEGLRDLRTSLKLEPRGSNFATCLHHVAIGLYFSRDYDEAVEAAQDSIRYFPEYPSSYRWLAAALGQLGCLQEAEEALGKAMAIAPTPFVGQRSPWYRSGDYARSSSRNSHEKSAPPDARATGRRWRPDQG